MEFELWNGLREPTILYYVYGVDVGMGAEESDAINWKTGRMEFARLLYSLRLCLWAARGEDGSDGRPEKSESASGQPGAHCSGSRRVP